METYKLPNCPHSHPAGSYYNLLPWNECYKDIPTNPTKITKVYPMCLHYYGQICSFYEKLIDKEVKNET